MTPFLQFRIWFRRATLAQQASAAIGVAILTALVVWTAVPSPTHGSNVATAGSGSSLGQPATSGGASGAASGPVSGATGASSAAVSPSTSVAAGSGSTGTGSTSGSAGGAQATAGSQAGTTGHSTGAGSTFGSAGAGHAAAGGCARRGSAKIGVVVPTAAGGAINAVVGSPPTSQEEADYAAVIDAVNKAGGVDCNTLVGDYTTADLTNPSSANQGCLKFQQDKVFAVVGGFEPLFSDDCLLQAHIPTFDQLPIPLATARQYYPYYYTDYSTYDLLYNNFAHAISQMGYFSSAHHFGKLGIFYESCNPAIHQSLMSALASVGISGSKVDTYNMGCNGAFAPQNTDQSAVLKFKTDGVTTATFDDDIADAQNVTTIANTEGWKPQWVLADYGEVSVTGSAQEHPNASNFDGAVAITGTQYGAIASKLPETPGTVACDKIMTSHNLPTVYQSGDQFAGSACSQIWMLVGALQHSGQMSAAGIAAGLQAAKSIQLSFPMGPNQFTGAGTTWGGEYWRPDTYHASCQCWMVDNPNFSPSFS